ncbi:hypothetical protein ACU5P1_14155 [Pseudomonas plecoglossicida]|uniref:hypothetical protein n=1 Tax=Pseudomonas plecoglossicida TaxID=70775 RepID=UPI00039B1A9D|nr:hypothetical protein HAV28_14000 [Pseudomonas plecoglossicida]
MATTIATMTATRTAMACAATVSTTTAAAAVTTTSATAATAATAVTTAATSTTTAVATTAAAAVPTASTTATPATAVPATSTAATILRIRAGCTAKRVRYEYRRCRQHRADGQRQHTFLQHDEPPLGVARVAQGFP